MEDPNEDFQWDPEVRAMLDDLSWEKELDGVEVKMDSGIHLLQSGAMCYSSMLLELFKDKKVEVNNFTIPTPRIPYPAQSSLTKAEMEYYIRMARKFKNKSITDVSFKSHKQYRDYKQLQNKVVKEQEVYQRYLLQNAPRFISEYNYVDREAVRWMHKVLNAAAIQIKNYERFYVHLKDFGISVMPFKNDPLPTLFEDLIVHLGTLKHLRTVTTSVTIPEHINYRHKIKSNSDSENTWKKTVISKDENARRLAIAWNADVVISHGSLQVLADNHSPFSNEWEIPIIVKEIADSAFGAKRKVVFVDKALPPKRVTPREKNSRYFKEVFKHLAEVQNIWDRFPTSNDSGDVEVKNKIEKNRKTSSSEFGNTSDEDENILQVDGADDKKSKKRKSSEKNDEASKETSRKSQNNTKKEKAKVTQPVKFPSFTELSTRTAFEQAIFVKNKNDESSLKSESGGFQPFIGKRTRSTSNESTKKSENKKVVKSKFTGMSFGLLPDSAIAVSQDESENEVTEEKQSKESKEEIVVKVESTSPETVTRRIMRNTPAKQKQVEKTSSGQDLSQSLFSSFGKISEERKNAKSFKSGSNMFTWTPAVSKKKSKKSLRPISSSESDSENEISLSVIKSKMTEKDTNMEPENSTPTTVDNTQNTTATADFLSTILPAQRVPTPDDTSGVSKLSTLKPFKPQPDLLGQILGKTTAQNRNLKDVSSAWSSEAKTMREGDLGLKYSSSDISLINPTSCRNVSYALWKFGKVRVLVRYALHGKLTAPSFGKKPDKKVGGVSLRAKLEYQSDYVFEQLTMSELCRDWVTILFKRPTKLVRARIDPFKREILDVEWLMTLNHLHDKAEQMGYNSAVTSKLLMKLFQMFSELDGGSYLCCHRADENKVVIREAVDDIRKKVVYDLHREYARPGRDVCYSTSVPWIPGDPNKPRKFHNSNDRVPMTFEPREGSKKKKK